MIGNVSVGSARSYMYYTAIRSLYRHVVCNAPFSCKANGDKELVGGLARQ